MVRGGAREGGMGRSPSLSVAEISRALSCAGGRRGEDGLCSWLFPCHSLHNLQGQVQWEGHHVPRPSEANGYGARDGAHCRWAGRLHGDNAAPLRSQTGAGAGHGPGLPRKRSLKKGQREPHSALENLGLEGRMGQALGVREHLREEGEVAWVLAWGQERQWEERVSEGHSR